MSIAIQKTVNVYEIGDGDWYVAECLADAIAFVAEQAGPEVVETALDEGTIKRLTADDLKLLKFHDEDTNTSRSFAKQLERLKKNQELATPDYFASAWS